MQSISEWWMWLGFFVFIFSMLVVDAFFLGGKKAHKISSREALSWVVTWIILALLFNLLLWGYLTQTVGEAIANEKSMEFLTGYLIEQFLSADNMFIFIMIFRYFSVPEEYQRRVLLFGVLGAVIMRLAMILLGVFLVSKFHWILYLFGVFLIVTGVKMLVSMDEKPSLKENPILQWMQKHLRITKEFHGEKFWVWKNKVRYITPLFLVLIFIELSDLVIALDSIPTIFAITDDPFIIFTSNIFAILGLRALYFLLANMMDRFHMLKYGLSLILIFIGAKMLLAYWIEIPTLIILSIVIILLASSVLLSLAKPAAKSLKK